MVMYDLTLCTVWSNMIMYTVLIDQYRLPLAIAYSARLIQGKSKVINKYIAKTTDIVLREGKTIYMAQRNKIRAPSHARHGALTMSR